MRIASPRHNLGRHGRRVHRSKIEKHRPGVEVVPARATVTEPAVIPPHKGRLPLAAIVEKRLRIPGIEGDCPGRRVPSPE